MESVFSQTQGETQVSPEHSGETRNIFDFSPQGNTFSAENELRSQFRPDFVPDSSTLETWPDANPNSEFNSECEVTPEEKFSNMFNSLPVTTITMVLNHSRKLDYYAAHNFLPIIRNVRIEPTKETAESVDIYFRGIPGGIYTLRNPKLGDRGLVYTIKKPFKNCTTIKLESEKAVYTMKLYDSCLHITGIYCVEDAIECQNYILYYLNLVEYVRRFVRTEEGMKTVQWVLEVTMGPWDPQCNDYLTILPAEIPSTVNTPTAYLLLSYEYGIPQYSHFASKVRFFAEQPWYLFLDEGDEYIKSTGFRTHMINYNYNLPFTVNCRHFSSYIDGYQQLTCRPMIKNPNVLHIELKHNCYIEDKKRRKKRVPHHTLTVNRSGAIAQSSPTFEEAHKLFLIFMQGLANYKGKYPEPLTMEG